MSKDTIQETLEVLAPSDVQINTSTELMYTREDGTVEYAESAQDAIDRCPVLGRIAVDSPETASFLLELTAVGNAKLDQQKTETTEIIIDKTTTAKLFDIHPTTEKSFPAAEKFVDISNPSDLDVLNEEILVASNTDNIQNAPRDNHDKQLLPPDDKNVFIKIDTLSSIDKKDIQSNALNAEVVKDDDGALTVVASRNTENFGSHDEPKIPTETHKIENSKKRSSQKLSQSELKPDTSATTRIDLSVLVDEVTVQKVFSSTSAKESDVQVDYNLGVTTEDNTESIVSVREINFEPTTNYQSSLQEVEIFNGTAESTSEESLEATFEIVAKSIEGQLKPSEEVVLHDVMSKITEIVKIMNNETIDDTETVEAMLSPEVVVLLKEVAELLGYPLAEITIGEYLQNHSIEQLNQVLYGLYKAYDGAEKKEIFGGSFTNLQYINDSKLRIGKHIFTLIIQGRLLSAPRPA